MEVQAHYPAPSWLVQPLIDRMSAEDRAELAALAGARNAADLILSAIGASSFSFCYTVDDVPVVIGGLRLPERRIWMVSARPLLSRIPKLLLRRSRIEATAMQTLAGGTSLSAVVDCRQSSSLKWLRWLGFRPQGETNLAGRTAVIMELPA